MYSPRIKDDLIQILYQLGKRENKSMTEVVDEILREYLTKIRLITSETIYPVKEETFIIKNGGGSSSKLL